jgi:hypothetical protein
MQNIWITLVTVPYFIILRAPKKMRQPSVIVEDEQEEDEDEDPDRLTYCQNLKVLLKNRSYVFLVLAYSLMVGLNCAFGISVYPLFEPLGFSTAQISTLGIFVVFFGVVSSMVNGILLKFFHKFLLMVRIQCFGTALFLLCAVYLFQTEYQRILALNMIIGAVFLVPIIPIGIAFAAELTFPTDETVSQGFLLMVSQGTGFILSNICILVSQISPTYGIILLAGCGTGAAICTLFIK